MSWEMVNLASKRICSVFSDGDWIETKDQSQDGIRLVQTGNVGVGKFKDKKNRARYISSDKFEELNCTEVLPGDLLVSRLPEPIGRSCIVPHTGEKMITSVDCTIIRTNEDVSTDFIKFYQRSERYYFELQKHVTGTTRKRISRSNLGKIKVPLPPLPEQQRIADILDKAEAITQKREQALALCDEFLRATFLDMFGDPVSNPKGWDIYNWEKVIDIKNGKNQKKVVQETGKYAIFGSGGEMGRANDFITPAFSVIIGRKGNINDPILITEPVWNVDTAFGLVPDTDVLLHDYLYWFCCFFDFLRLNKTVTIPSLRKVDLYEIQIPIPPIELQQKFSNIVEKVNGIKARIQHAQELPLFDALSQQAFKGELT